ncbi:MAG TPA: apolipoprotein N-acyltransferase [Rhabdochlamydiaceae bacterium]|nr:apolipoprotein N-acyltransferase [Rhabdochlamydiaceae bacterium]
MISVILSFLIVAFGQPAFIPFLGLLAALLGYALFWKSVLNFSSKSRRFWLALAWYTGVQAVQLSWMSANEYQGIYIHFVHAGLALFLGLQFAFFTLFVKKENSILSILVLSSLWTLIECSRFLIFCGFTFNPAGLALSSYIWPLQMASIWGVLGLSFWVIFVNLMTLRALLQKKWTSYFACALTAIFPYFWGFCHLSYHEFQKNHSPKTISILLLQTGLLPSEKVTLAGKLKDFISPYQQWRRILQIIKEHGPADFIVLPEAAVPFSSDLAIYSFEKTQKIFKELLGEGAETFFPDKTAPFFNEKKSHVTNCFWAQALSNYFGSEIIIGLDYNDSKKQLNYNSAFQFCPKKEALARYDKRILIPLAEYLPFKWLYPLVKSYGITDFFTHGEENNLFDGCLPLSVSICYEETFPHLVREGRLKGAKLLVNLTNDGWYPRSKLAQQHFDLARLRAVENGVTLVRSCNTGITGAIDCTGRILTQLPEYGLNGRPFVGAAKVQINTYNYPTLYTFWGNWGIIGACLFFILLFLIFKITEFVREKNH